MDEKENSVGRIRVTCMYPSVFVGIIDFCMHIHTLFCRVCRGGKGLSLFIFSDFAFSLSIFPIAVPSLLVNDFGRVARYLC